MLQNRTNDSKNSDCILTNCYYSERRASVCISIVENRRQRFLLYAEFVVQWIIRNERGFIVSKYHFVQKKTTSICVRQIEHHIKFNFIRIICISFTKSIWRNSVSFGERYWDVSTYYFYRYAGFGQQSHQKGRRSRKICGSIEVNL